jgi:hypothetical protein
MKRILQENDPMIVEVACRFRRPGANIAKVVDFGDKDLLQHIDLARISFGEVIPLRTGAR